MARPQKPWFRTGKDTWYATVHGKKVSLGVKDKENETPKLPVRVGMVIRAFLADAESRAKAKTMRIYRYFLLPFAEAHGERPVDDLKPTLAQAYSRKPAWKQQTRHSFLTTLVTAFRWAEQAGMVDRSPLVGVRKPPKASRGMEALLTPEEYARLLDAATPLFRLFLKVLYGSGARPGEVAAITAENFDPDAGLVRLAEHKTSHKGFRRVIYLTPEAVALLVQQRERYQSGLLLRNSRGQAWTQNSIGLALRRTRERAGIPHAIAYGLRYTFATDALANGVPDAQVAELLGHQGTAMLHRHYAHLGAKAKVLRDALGQVRPTEPEDRCERTELRSLFGQSVREPLFVRSQGLARLSGALTTALRANGCGSSWSSSRTARSACWSMSACSATAWWHG
jgi:integrase